MSEIWFLFAFLAAFSWATSDLLNKLSMSKGENEYNALLSRFLWAIPIIFLFYLKKSGLKTPEYKALIYIILVITGDISASLLYMKALKIGEISIVAPLTSFAPIFMVLTSIVILGEPPSKLSLFGILLVSLGSYILGIKNLQKGLLKPLTEVLLSKPGIYTICAAFIFSIDTSIAKVSLRYTDIYSFSFWYTLLFAIIFIILSKILNRPISPKSIAMRKGSIMIGILFGLGTISFMKAIETANISYVSAIGKVNMVISVIYGRIFFKERNFKNKLIGTIIILAGVILVITGSGKTET